MVKKAMLDRRADIGLLVDTPHAEGLRCQPVAREPMYFCGQDAEGGVRSLLHPPEPGVPGRPCIDFADAAAQPLVLQSRRFSIRRQVEEGAAARGVALNISHEHDSARVIRSLYACGAGFTFTPACALGDAPLNGPDWLVARVIHPDLTRTYSLATAEDRDMDGVMQAVVEGLHDVVCQLVTAGKWEAETFALPGYVPSANEAAL